MKMHVYSMQLTSNEANKCKMFDCATTRNYLLPIFITSADGRKYLLAHGNKNGEIGLGNKDYDFNRLIDLYVSILDGQNLNVITCYGYYFTDLYDNINGISVKHIFKTHYELYSLYNTYQLVILTHDEMHIIPEGFEYHGLREYEPEKNIVDGFEELTLLKYIE